MSKTFLEAKYEFDNLYKNPLVLTHSIVPVDGKYIENITLKNKSGEPNEEFYKWQFIYSLIHSDLFSKDYLGAEVYFPKGNKSSAPLKIDTCIFSDKSWIEYYTKWRSQKDTEAIDWLRKNLIATVEFKKSDGKDTKAVFTSQVKPELKESER